MGKFWGNGSLNMMVTATPRSRPRKPKMNSKKVVAKVATAAIVVLVPIGTLSARALAEPKDAARTQRRDRDRR